MSVLINASTSTGLVQSADTSGEIELQSNGTTALKVNTNEGIQILNCLGVGNATPSTSGAGITFPASQSTSSDANTLDDYEEGTWTPTVARTGSSYTFGARSGYYTKIGRSITLQGYVQISAITTQGSGYITVTGIPFANVNSSNANFAGPVFYNTLASTSTIMSVGVFVNEAFLYLKSATRNEDPVNENTTTGYLMFTITYFTA
jgi:hypothetical protein